PTPSAARSPPVCPPEITFKDFDVTVASEISPAIFLDLHSVYRRSGSDFSIACRNDIHSFDHKNDGAFRRARAMSNPFWNNKTLTRCELDCFIFEVDQEFSVEHKKEFVDVVMLVPVIFAFQHSEPNNRIVHLAKRLVVPLIFAGVGQLLNVDYFKRAVQNIQERFIGKIL